MDEVFEYMHSCNRKDLDEFFRLKIEMETRQDKNDEKQKENEKDEKKTYKENDRFDNHYLNR